MENHHLTTLSHNSQGETAMLVKHEDSLSLSSASQAYEEDVNRSMKLNAKSKIIKKTAASKKKYDNISNELRLKLIDAVETKGQKIKLAAKLLGINYSSAKSICQIFKREGRSNKKIFKKKGPKEESLNSSKEGSLEISKNRDYTSKSNDFSFPAKGLLSESTLNVTKNTSLQNIDKQLSSDEKSDLFTKKSLKVLDHADVNLKNYKDTYLNFPNPFKPAKDEKSLLSNFGLLNGQSIMPGSQLNVNNITQSELLKGLPNFLSSQGNSISLAHPDASNLINNLYGSQNPLLQTLTMNHNSLLIQNGLNGLAGKIDPNLLSQLNKLPYQNHLELLNGKDQGALNLNMLNLRPELQYQAFLNPNLLGNQINNPSLLFNGHSNLGQLNMFPPMGGYPNLEMLQNPALLQLQTLQKSLQPSLNNGKK